MKVTSPKFEAELVADQDYLPALLGLLSLAKKKIDIVAYSFAIGSMAGKLSAKGAPLQIADHLIALRSKNKKLKIRLYIEGERDTAERNTVTAKYLERHGIEVVHGATHAKGFCVDDRFTLFGSTNLTNQSITKNNEANVYIDSKTVSKQFEAYFEHLWNGGRHGGVKLKSPFLADQDFLPAMIDMIDKAKKQIDFSIYFFDQDDIRDALIRAHERGIPVTGFVHQHFSFALSYIRRNFRTVKALKAAGIEDISYSQPHTFSHSKYIVVDRKEIMLGTGNWLDEDVETHPQLYIRLSSAKLGRKLIKAFADANLRAIRRAPLVQTEDGLV